jgi:hypothetical protein
MALRLEELAKTIDCTMLDPRAGAPEVGDVARRARDLHLASLCVLPQHVAAAAEELRGSDVKVCAVVGYPEGADAAKAKVAEAERCLDEGAGELARSSPASLSSWPASTSPRRPRTARRSRSTTSSCSGTTSRKAWE